MSSAPQRSDEKQGARAGNLLPSLICQPILRRLTSGFHQEGLKVKLIAVGVILMGLESKMDTVYKIFCMIFL